MKIQLVQGIGKDAALSNEKWMLPLNLIVLGTYIEQFGYDIEIIDGLHKDIDSILGRLDGDIVGINFNIFSVDAMEEIAAYAKSRGSFVVVGGQAATPLSKQLLSKNKDIDAVIRYDGEEALKQVADRLKKKINDLKGIPNLSYRKDGEILEEKVEQLNIQKSPVPNRRINGIVFEDYIHQWKGDSFIRPTNTYTKQGCIRNCGFCGRIYKGIRAKTPQQVFEEDKTLVEEFGVNFIYENSDTYFFDKKWLRQFKEVYDKNGGLPVKYWAFCNIQDIDKETVEIMSKLNVHIIGIGIESGNETVRRGIGKNFTNKQVFEAAKMLGEAGIKMEDAYILGLPGETEDTLRETYELSEKVAESCDIYNRGFSLMLPLPGSPIWEKMMQIPELKEKYGDRYKFDIEELRRDYIKSFCRLDI